MMMFGLWLFDKARAPDPTIGAAQLWRQVDATPSASNSPRAARSLDGARASLDLSPQSPAQLVQPGASRRSRRPQDHPPPSPCLPRCAQASLPTSRFSPSWHKSTASTRWQSWARRWRARAGRSASSPAHRAHAMAGSPFPCTLVARSFFRTYQRHTAGSRSTAVWSLSWACQSDMRSVREFYPRRSGTKVKAELKRQLGLMRLRHRPPTPCYSASPTCAQASPFTTRALRRCSHFTRTRTHRERCRERLPPSRRSPASWAQSSEPGCTRSGSGSYCPSSPPAAS